MKRPTKRERRMVPKQQALGRGKRKTAYNPRSVQRTEKRRRP